MPAAWSKRSSRSHRNVAHRLIEEFMLLANETVASYLDAQNAPALYRVHEEPDVLKVAKFEDFVSGFGYSLGAPLTALRPRHFQKLIERIHGKPEEKPIAFLMLRTMQKARYAPENLGHFGLAASSYTHFTSPIRRYPDLVVHRALRAARHALLTAKSSAKPGPRICRKWRATPPRWSAAPTKPSANCCSGRR